MFISFFSDRAFFDKNSNVDESELQREFYSVTQFGLTLLRCVEQILHDQVKSI